VELLFSIALLLSSYREIAPDRQTRTVPLPPDRTLTLTLTVGTVEIIGVAGTDATIEIVRTTPSVEGLTRLPIEVEETEREVRIRCIQADGGTDPAYRSDVVIRVPSAARVGPVNITEGRLELSNLSGAITADIRRGSIEGSAIEGVVRLESGIGDVVLDRARLSTNGLLRLRSFNGNVRLTLAERPTDARIMALALNGTIASDIPLAMKDTWGPRWGEATLGKGEPVISLDVITGRIEIKSK
jgi:hypothetical protein